MSQPTVGVAPQKSLLADRRARLADGRDILYYDDTPGRRYDARPARDTRGAEPLPSASELRFDPMSANWTAIAGHRQTRTYKPPASQCPLCPSTVERATEIPDAQYDVVVFENRFPSFSARAVADGMDEFKGGSFTRAPGTGRCEVVCFTSDHHASLHQLSVQRVETVIRALAHRTLELGSRPGIAYVYCFENRGEEIGVTLLHPHGQVYALPLMPPRVEALAAAATEHLARTGECLQCGVLADELTAGTRIVQASRHWVAYVPFAARWPYEVRVVARRHCGSLPELDDHELADLAHIYRDVLARFDSLDPTDQVPYIAGWLQAPWDHDAGAWHLAVEVFTIRRAPGRLKYLAGIESGAGLWVNDVLPERAAAQLRDGR